MEARRDFNFLHARELECTAEAFPWLLRAAEQGSAEAQSEVAWALWYGHGVKQDEERAEE